MKEQPLATVIKGLFLTLPINTHTPTFSLTVQRTLAFGTESLIKDLPFKHLWLVLSSPLF